MTLTTLRKRKNMLRRQLILRKKLKRLPEISKRMLRD